MGELGAVVAAAYLAGTGGSGVLASDPGLVLYRARWPALALVVDPAAATG